MPKQALTEAELERRLIVDAIRLVLGLDPLYFLGAGIPAGAGWLPERPVPVSRSRRGAAP